MSESISYFYSTGWEEGEESEDFNFDKNWHFEEEILAYCPPAKLGGRHRMWKE